MAPSTFSLSLFAPFLRRSKKYKKLETDEPEKRKQDEANDELTRINFKIDKLLNSMSKEDTESAINTEDQCVTCRASRAVMMVYPCNHVALCRLCFVKMIKHAVSSRQLPLCCVVCNTKIQRVKNNNSREATSASDRKSIPSSVSGYSLAKSVSNYSIKSAASSSSHVSGRSVRSSASLQSISSIRSTGSGSSWFSVNSLSSFQCAGLDRNHNNKPRPHSLLSSGSRHRLSVGSGKSLKQSISSPAISDIIKSKGPPSSQSVDNFRQLPPPINPEILSPTSSCGPQTQAKSREMKRRVKSPDLHETTFIMSTIEEEIESVHPVAFHT